MLTIAFRRKMTILVYQGGAYHTRTVFQGEIFEVEIMQPYPLHRSYTFCDGNFIVSDRDIAILL